MPWPRLLPSLMRVSGLLSPCCRNPSLAGRPLESKLNANLSHVVEIRVLLGALESAAMVDVVVVVVVVLIPVQWLSYRIWIYLSSHRICSSSDTSTSNNGVSSSCTSSSHCLAAPSPPAPSHPAPKAPSPPAPSHPST